MEAEPSSKRRKLDDDVEKVASQPLLRSLSRAISPPPSRPRRTTKPDPIKPKEPEDQTDLKTSVTQTTNEDEYSSQNEDDLATKPPKSPFRLTTISSLPSEFNIQTFSLHSILGAKDITEAWLFDYLFDLDFIMAHFHPSVRQLVKVYIMHGSWNKESGHRQRIDEQEKKWPNIKARCAYMPDRFGTHHSKMMVLFYRDGRARVVVHTANMIEFDWANMTQGGWFSPKLVKINDQLEHEDRVSGKDLMDEDMPIGSGGRFKADLLSYLRKYEYRTEELVSQLERYEFSPVRAAFIASAPGSQDPKSMRSLSTTLFGWPGLKRILSSIPTSILSKPSSKTDTVVMQCSSIATVSENWANYFFNVLFTTSTTSSQPAMFGQSGGGKPKMKIVFPTVQEIRDSLNGYESGGSIHLKGSSPGQRKQLGWLRPMFCRWGGSTASSSKDSDEKEERNAMRAIAAPHIKTFIRYDGDFSSIKWAMLTSANFSTQAWGGLPSDKEGGKVKISSYETGVVVWPELFSQEKNSSMQLVPVFGRDDLENSSTEYQVALRLPYCLPLKPYEKNDWPWCKTEKYREVDRWGHSWPGIQY